MLSLFERHQTRYFDVRNVHVDDPIHQIEADETDRKDDATVLVDVRRTDAQHAIRIFWAERRWKGGRKRIRSGARLFASRTCVGGRWFAGRANIRLRFDETIRLTASVHQLGRWLLLRLKLSWQSMATSTSLCQTGYAAVRMMNL